VRRRAAVIAWAVLVATVVTSAAGGVLDVLRQASVHGVPPAVPSDVQYIANAILYAVAGVLIARRRPENPIWMALAGAGLCGGVFGLLAEYTIYSQLVVPGGLPGQAVATWVSAWIFPTIPALTVLVLLLFPTGTTLTPRWRFAPLLVATGYLLAIVGLAFHPRWIQNRPEGSLEPIHNPLGLAAAGPALDVVNLVGNSLLGIAFVLGAISLALRYRRGSVEERQQLKVLVYTAAFVPLSFVLYPVTSQEGAITPITVAALALTSIGVLGIPIAMGVAILKYRLYDIDVVISRTLVYGALAAFITIVYVAIVVGVGTLFGSGGQPNLILSIIATAIVAVAFQPVRERLQALANRLVYGQRATPYEVLSRFSERVAETYAAEEALPRMARVLAEGTGADQAQVWLRAGRVLRPAATWPATNGSSPPAAEVVADARAVPELPGDQAVAVIHRGELLGALSVTKRAGELLTPIEQKLLDDLANQAGLVLKNVGLTADLHARLDDLRASRQRLVAAQDEERRRLERNLHDGAQQNLVALKVKLALAETLAASDPARAKALLSQLKGDTDEALETLRDLARGIYPPLLADKGLTAAIESQARKATVPVAVQADGVGRYPQDVEAAVYFCVLEALQNIQKYAGASRATVRIRADDGALSFEIEDDGRGFDATSMRRGAGLTNMADRLDALGGGVEIDSAPGQGTRLRGRLPLEAPAAV
jgi:signal transduction histidine kinase